MGKAKNLVQAQRRRFLPAQSGRREKEEDEYKAQEPSGIVSFHDGCAPRKQGRESIAPWMGDDKLEGIVWERA
jgi:hypothetical protein